MGAGRRAGRPPPWALPAAIGVLALALRLYGLGDKPFWLDEIASLRRATSSLHDLIANSLRNKHYPSYFLLLWMVAKIGTSQWLLRLPSALFGALDAALACAIGSRAAGRRSGLIAGLLMAVSPFEIQFGQEARSYTLVSCLILIALWGLVRLAQDPAAAGLPLRHDGAPRGAWLAYGLGTAAALDVLNVAVPWLVAANLGAVGDRLARRRAQRRFLAQLGDWSRRSFSPPGCPPSPGSISPARVLSSMARAGRRRHPEDDLGDHRPGLPAADFELHYLQAAAGRDSRPRRGGRRDGAVGRVAAAPRCRGAGGARRRRAGAAVGPAGGLAVRAGDGAALFRLECGAVLYLCRRRSRPALSAPLCRGGGGAGRGMPDQCGPLLPFRDQAALGSGGQQLAAKGRPGDVVLLDNYYSYFVLSTFAARAGLADDGIILTWNLPEALRLAPGHQLWAVYGRTGQAAKKQTPEVFRNTLAGLGRPVSEKSVGRYIVLWQFDEPTAVSQTAAPPSRPDALAAGEAHP